MNATLFENAFGYPMYHETDPASLRKEDEELRQLLISKGIDVSDDFANDAFFVSLLFLVIRIWEFGDAYNFVCEDFVKALHKDLKQSDGTVYAVTVELTNGYDLSFFVTGEPSEYEFEVFIHGGAKVTDAPAFDAIINACCPLDNYIPHLIAALPENAHLITEFEAYLDSDLKLGFEAYDVETQEELMEKLALERERLAQKYGTPLNT